MARGVIEHCMMILCATLQHLMAHTLLPQARDIKVAATLEMMRARCRLGSCIFAVDGKMYRQGEDRSGSASIVGQIETVLVEAKKDLLID